MGTKTDLKLSIYLYSQFAKIYSRKILIAAQFAKINSREMFEKKDLQKLIPAKISSLKVIYMKKKYKVAISFRIDNDLNWKYLVP